LERQSGWLLGPWWWATSKVREWKQQLVHPLADPSVQLSVRRWEQQSVHPLADLSVQLSVQRCKIRLRV
jgi:hypothetical protein